MAEGSGSQVSTAMRPAENNIREINTAQCDVSRLLQMAYIATKKHPDIAGQIRLTAHLARTQRSECSALISSFELNARHVRETLMPMILQGVQIQEPSIITGGLEQVLHLAESMKTETQKAKEQCKTIQTQVQGHIGQIEIHEKQVRDRMFAMRFEKEKSAALAKQAEENLAAQNKVLERIQKEGKERREQRKGLQVNYDKAAADIRCRENEIVLGAALFPTLIVPEVDIAVQVTAGLINLVGQGINAVRKHKALNQAAGQLNKADDQILENERLERAYMMEQQKIKEERLKQLHAFKKLCLEAETTGDVSGLVDASERLGDVDKLLSQLIGFWNTMVLCITCLINDTSAGKVYITSIKNGQVQDIFLQAIEKAKKGWSDFERMCRWYHDVCEGNTAASNKQLYDFLSRPIDNMSREELRAHQQEIAQRIEADIAEAGLGDA